MYDAKPCRPPGIGHGSAVGIVIGHTTHDSTTLWVRGSGAHRWAGFALRQRVGGRVIHSGEIELRRDRDYSAAMHLGGLRPATQYDIAVRFAASAAGLGGASLERPGRLRTFPDEESDAGFSFLLGSCNLSTARLTALRELVAGYLGMSALRRSLGRPVDDWYWPAVPWPRPALRWIGSGLAGALLWGVERATRFELPEPDFPSPFEPLCGELDGDEPHRAPPAFMIHAGDQIYFDLDVPQRDADAQEYRRSYRQAWLEDPHARTVLASCPHYMILDDHEIQDGFDDTGSPRARAAALEAYRQYVDARQPGGGRDGGPLHYRFRHGRTFFFVLDTRTERGRDRMIGPAQLAALLCWLRQHRTDLKFVVSSVPFVAELADRAERSDKWCGERYRRQRDEIIDAIHALAVERLVFLVGDMHCAYHATMRVGPPARRLAVHELAGGPINQVRFARRPDFLDQYQRVTAGGNPCRMVMRSFQSGVQSVTRITVGAGPAPRVGWRIVRTDARAATGGQGVPGPLCGQIGFGA